MLSTYIRSAQFVELALYGLIGYGLGWSAAAIVAGMVVLVLLARLLFVGASFFLAWMYRPRLAPEHRIGPLATIAMVFREYRSLLAFNLLYVPWEAISLRRDPQPAPSSRAPIVVIHGYFANRAMFRPLVGRLEAAGYGPVFAPNLRSWHASIERFEADLAANLERIAAGCGRRAIVIAHSMGGLGIRLHLASHGARHVEHLISISSPHRGTALAPFAIGPSAGQMRIGSAFLKDLQAREGAGPGIPALCIYSTHDNMVTPPETSRLPWARTRIVRGRGHLEMAHCEEVFALLREELGPPGG